MRYLITKSSKTNNNALIKVTERAGTERIAAAEVGGENSVAVKI